MEIQGKYPFKFLDAYGRADRDIFFGREEEIETLYQMVFQTDLILVYGASGTGKTSIIQCGLASRFQPYEWMALSIRRGDNLNASLEAALGKEGATAEKPDSSDDLDWLLEGDAATETAPSSPVAQKIRQLYLTHFKPVFLIFDQFEELYILGTKEEQQVFMATIRDILRMEQPVKILISIREEYLGYLYEFERQVPELLRKKLRIEPMHLEKVCSIVSGINRLGAGSIVSFPREAEAEIGRGIFDKLKDRENILTIELPYLQVFLDKMYLQITGDTGRTMPAVITPASLEAMGQIGDVLRNFLDEQVLENARRLKLSPETIKKLLTPFVTLDGTKEPLSAQQLHARLPELEAELINRSLQAFQDGRILRFDEKEQRYEVTHDSLARQIATYQDAEDVARQKALQIIRTQVMLEGDRREVFSVRQLDFIEPHLEKLELSEAEKDWIDHSRRYREAEKRREALETEKQLRQAMEQAEKEKHLRERAVKNEKRARQRARIALLVTAAALVLAVMAGVFKVRADEAKANAELEKSKAVKASEAALASQEEAEKERDNAKKQEAIAIAATKAAADNLDKAEQNLRRARRQERKTKDALAQVEEEKTATDKQRQRAEDALKEAEAATRVAAGERDNARKALDELAISNRQVVRLLLSNIEKDVLSLKYEDAYEKVKSAASLNVEKPDVAAAAFELAFWYGETGEEARADSLLERIYQLLDKPWNKNSNVREVLAAADPRLYEEMMQRYYPFDTVPISGGTFEMGCKPGRDDVYAGRCFENESLHTRTIGRFAMMRHEVTWWQYMLFCKATQREYEAPGWGISGDNPVVYVSWEDARAYSDWLNGRFGFAAGKGFRLPSEAEWEYAARGGEETAFAGVKREEDLEDYAWYDVNSQSRTQSVKTKKPNGYGLYDMSGNVWEWCQDWYGEYPESAEMGYQGPKQGSFRVLRGGGWYYRPVHCRVASRHRGDPDYRNDYIGFRLVFVPQSAWR